MSWEVIPRLTGGANFIPSFRWNMSVSRFSVGIDITRSGTISVRVPAFVPEHDQGPEHGIIKGEREADLCLADRVVLWSGRTT